MRFHRRNAAFFVTQTCRENGEIGVLPWHMATMATTTLNRRAE